MDTADVRKLIDSFLAADKVVVGFTSWAADLDGESCRWIGVIEIEGEQPGILLVVKAYPRDPALKFRIMLGIPRVFWRLDYDHDGHQNPLTAPFLPGALITEPHYHPWQDNRRQASANSLPRRLKNARLLPASIRTFNAAFRWFADETNLRISSLDMPELPRSDTLL